MIKLLHVEDDEDIREIAEMALGLSGTFEVLQCECGPDALAVAEGFAPDVLLLDVMMPGMTGRETLQELRKIPSLQETTAIFMTARAQVGEQEELRALGAAHVISKPFDPMTLGDQIMDVLNAAN